VLLLRNAPVFQGLHPSLWIYTTQQSINAIHVNEIHSSIQLMFLYDTQNFT
jgi:hypothetical protein